MFATDMSARQNRSSRSNLFAIGAGALVLAIFGGAIALSLRQAPEKAPVLLRTNAPTPAPAEEEPVEFDIDKATEHLLRGNEHLARQDFAKAVEEFQLAAKFNPEDEDIFYNLGLALAQKGDTEAAKTNYLKALELFPDYVEAHINLGNMLVRQGEFGDAIEHLQAAVKADPENAAAHNNLGNAMARQKRSREAIVHFEEAVRLQPNYPEAQFNLGNAYLLNGRAEEAAEQFATVLKMHPNFPRAHEQLLKAKAALPAGGPAK